MELKDRIKQMRDELKISTSRLGADMDKSDGAVRSWETGRAYPDVSTLIKLSQYFNVSVDYLLGITDYKTAAEQEKAVESKTALDEQINLLQGSEEKKEFIRSLNETLTVVNRSKIFPLPVNLTILLDLYKRLHQSINNLYIEGNENVYIQYLICSDKFIGAARYLSDNLLKNVLGSIESDIRLGIVGSVEKKEHIVNILQRFDKSYQEILNNEGKRS